MEGGVATRGPEGLGASRRRLLDLADTLEALGAADASVARLRGRVDALAERIERVEATAATRPAPAPVVAVEDDLPPAPADVVVPDTPPEPAPPRVRRSPVRVVRRAAPALVATLGVLITADAVLTVVWQEPLTALSAHRKQDELAGKLDALTAQLRADDARIPDTSKAASLAEAQAAASAALVATPPQRLSVAPASRTAQTNGYRFAGDAERLLKRSKPGSPLGRIRLPSVGANFVMVQDTGEAQLKTGPGHYATTALPGQRGTVGIAGHRTTYSAPFRHIDRLKKRSRIVVEMPYATFVYRVERTRIVSPQDTSVLKYPGYDRIVLTACHPLYSAAQRIVVSARLSKVLPA